MLRYVISILILFFTTFPVFAEDTQKQDIKPANQIKETYKLNGHVQYDDNEIETIYLDEDIEKPQVNIPKRTLTLPVELLNITSNANSPRSALARAMVNRGQLYDILPLAGSITENYRGFSYGQTWGQDLSYSQIEDSTSFFVRYDFPKFLSFATSIRQSTNQDIGTQYNTLRLTPEFHITDRLTVKDSFISYMNLPKNKNEITLVYTPSLQKYADALKFELGFVESYYRSGQRSSAVSFSTGFKL